MIKKVLRGIKMLLSYLRPRQPIHNPEAHEYKSQLQSASSRATSANREYAQVLQKANEEGITFHIVLAQGGKKRGLK